MKTYIANSTTRDGDHEYGEQFVLEAKNQKEAEAKAKRALLKFHGRDPDEDSFDQDDRLNLFDTIVQLERVHEIPKADFAVLKKYLYETVLLDVISSTSIRSYGARRKMVLKFLPLVTFAGSSVRTSC